jgi:uncharacterized membrane protein
VSTLQHSLVIHAPVDAVWSVLSDLTAVGAYNPIVVAVRITSAALQGVGAARYCDLAPKGWVEERVTAWEPPRQLGLEVVGSSWPLAEMRWTTSLSAVPAGTAVTQSTTYRVKFGPAGAVLDALVLKRQLRRAIDAALGSFKSHVEAAARTAPKARPVEQAV